MKINKLYKYICFVLTMIFISGHIEAQNKAVVAERFTGTVVDVNQQPLNNVTVSLQEKAVSTLTDSEGKFEIEMQLGDVVVLEKEGYKTLVERFRSENRLSFTMVKYLPLEDIDVNIGYGMGNQRFNVSSVSSIKSDIIEKNAVSNIEQAMNGTLGGLFSLTRGGTKYGLSNLAFFVRGKVTNADASPLILVDDLEADIDLINYNDIESVSVLKDASALAIYGLRGANGVILMKTKQGSRTHNSMQFDIRTGIQQAEHISNRLNAFQYTTLHNEARLNDGQTPMYDPSIYQGDYNRYTHPDENFKDQFLKNTSPYQQYNFSARGGNNVAQYYVAVGYLKQEGLFKESTKNNRYERYNFRSNVDVNLIKGLTMGVRIFAGLDNHRFPYNDGKWSLEATNDIFSKIISTPANAYPIFNEDGSLGGTAAYSNNIYGMLNNAGQRTDNSNVFGTKFSVKGDLGMLLKGLSIEGFMGLENFNKQQISIFKQFAVYELQPGGSYNKYGVDDDKDQRESAQIGGFYRYMSYGGALNYDNAFGLDHRISSKLLFTQSSETREKDEPDIKYQGLALRTGYSFKNKYLSELTLAYQGSNNYKSGSRFGLFPALGLGWIVTEEDFMKDMTSISFAKIRTSYGVNGNDRTNTRRFPYRQEWTSGGGYAFGNPNGNTPGSQAGALGNPDASWEKAYKLNLGLDVTLLNDLNITFEYFNEKRKDIMVDHSNIIPDIIGIDLTSYNGGQINNNGLDVNLTYNKQFGDLGFMAQGNVLWAKNKIIDLKETAHPYEHMYRKGHSINTRFGYKTDGFYTDASQLANAPASAFGVPQLGDLKYINQNPNDDNVINSLDQVAIGNAFPEFIYGAIIGLNYKGFDFATALKGVGEYDTYVRPAAFSKYAYDNRWNPANPSVETLYPRLSIGSTYNTEGSDFWQESGKSLTVSSIEMGYTLPTTLVNKVKLSSIRVYVNGNNIYRFAKTKEGRNPEAVAAGYSELPLLRTYSLGISIKL